MRLKKPTYRSRSMRIRARPIALLLALLLFGVASASRAELIPLYSWWSAANGDNMSTSDPRWKGTQGATREGYGFVRIEGYLHSPDASRPANTVPLYRWWSPSRGDYFTTSQPAWAGSPGRGKDGYAFVRLEGYLPTQTSSSRVPLMSFWSPSRQDNFATSNPSWTSLTSGSPDYRRYRTEGYLEKTAGFVRYAGVLQSSALQNMKFVLKTPDEARAETEERNRDLNPNAEGASLPIPLHGGEPLVDQLSKFGIDDVQELLNLSTTVFEDRNRDSGMYYYLPRGWALKWTADDGHFLDFFNKPAGESGKNTLVNMTMSAANGASDWEILKELLEAYLRRNPSRASSIQLVPLPPDWDLEFDWSAWIDEQPVMPQVSDDSGEFVVSVSVDAAEQQLLVESLEDRTLTLGGNVRYRSEGFDRTIVANLNLADDSVYGRSPWARNSAGTHTEFRNEHSFTVRLDHLLYLRKVGGQLKLRGYDLGRQPLVPGAIAKMPNDAIHPEIDDEATIHAWYDYSFEPTEAELDSVLDAFRGGVGSIPETQVRIRISNTDSLFEQYGIDLVMVRVKSRYFDPDPKETDWDEKTYEFARGAEATQDLATLFTPPDAVGSIYEYKVIVYTAHDEVASDWLQPSANNPELIFVRTGQIEEILGE